MEEQACHCTLPINEPALGQENTVVEEVPCSPGPVFDGDRIEILVTPTWVLCITARLRSEFQVEWLWLREAEAWTILESFERSHSDRMFIKCSSIAQRS